MTDADTLRMLEEAARSAIPFDAGRVRSGRDDKGTLDRKRWQSIAEQGWLGILVPEEQGGLALELDAATAVATVLGATAAPEPFVAAGVLAPMLLADCPASERRDEHLVSVVSGDRVTCLAWQDISGSLEIGAAELAAHQDGDGFTISGECRFVPVPDADAFLVAARSDGAPGLFWVARDAAGLVNLTGYHSLYRDRGDGTSQFSRPVFPALAIW